MSAIRYYRWDDAGAPTLSGTVGSLTALLRACLVGTAGVAYASKPSAGWTEEFIGAAANIAVFKNSAADGGCECMVQVNDNAVGAGLAREARVVVYATMSNISTGTNGTAPLWINKSATASTLARKWFVVADARTAWVYAFDTGEGTWGGNASLLGFGDLESKLPASSANRYFCTGRQYENQNPGAQGLGWCTVAEVASLQVANPTGTTAPVAAYGITTPFVGSRPIGSSVMGPGADPETGDYLLQRYPPLFNGYKYIGLLRGLYIPFGNFQALTQGAFVPGSTSMVVVRGNTNNNNNDFFVFNAAVDAVGPW